MSSDSEAKTTEQKTTANSAPDEAPTAVQPSGETPWQRSGGRRITVHVMIALATLFTIVAVFANWTRQQLLDTNAWTKASAELIANPVIRDQVAIYLVDQLYTNVDVPAEIKTVLPKELQPLAPVAAAGARNLITKAANAALEQPAVQSVWTEANKLAHEQFVTAMNGGTSFISTTNGDVTINLGGILTKISTSLGLPSSVTAKIPPGAGEITVIQSQELKQAQQITRALKTSSVVFSVLAFLLFVAAVALAAGARATRLVEVGVGLVLAALAVVVLRSAVGDQVVSSLVTDVSLRPAVSATWDIETSLLAQIATQVAVVGAMLIIAGLLGGPTQAAHKVRGFIAPVVNRFGGACYAVVGLLVLGFLIWAPIPAASRPSFIVVFIILIFFGFYSLRRETLADFPDASIANGHPVHDAGARIGAAFSRAGASVKETTSRAAADVRTRSKEVVDKTMPGGDKESQKMAKLERLVALRDGGALTDEEFAAEKQKILGEDGTSSS